MTSTTTSKRRRRALRAAAPAVGLLAAGLLVWQGSYAAFSATTVNQNDAWSTGQLTLTNDGHGNGTAYNATTTATFGEILLVPGQVGTKCITVKNEGNVKGDLRMTRGAIATTGSAVLADQLKLDISTVTVPAGTNVKQDCTGLPAGTTAPVAATVSGFPAAWADAAAAQVTDVAAGDRIAYKITYTFVPTSDNATDNTLATATVTTDFKWEIQSTTP